MEVQLRKRVLGGWWDGLAGWDAEGNYYDDTPDAVIGIVGNTDPGPPVGSYEWLLAQQTEHGDIGSPSSYPEGSYEWLLAQQTEYGDIGTPSTMGVPTAGQILTAIQGFAQIGIQALAPNSMTGACPVNYGRNGAACVPLQTMGAPTQTAGIGGISTKSLLLIGGGVFLLMLVSGSGGGKRR